MPTKVLAMNPWRTPREISAPPGQPIKGFLLHGSEEDTNL